MYGLPCCDFTPKCKEKQNNYLRTVPYRIAWNCVIILLLKKIAKSCIKKKKNVYRLVKCNFVFLLFIIVLSFQGSVLSYFILQNDARYGGIIQILSSFIHLLYYTTIFFTPFHQSFVSILLCQWKSKLKPETVINILPW